ncbi:MAG: M6 family metalloprotease domain-containing protein [Clostridia bacterium]|nr:M6 family metalloprotease domain-containing protein [Clostridia bacterium]
MIKTEKIILWVSMVLFMIVSKGIASFAVPYNGNILEVKQPDGSKVQVKMWGDEFYQEVESLDGFALCFDNKSNTICYADLNKDGSELISTGIPYNGKNLTTGLAHRNKTIQKGLRIHSEAKSRKVQEKKSQLKVMDSTPAFLRDNRAEGQKVGLTILIDFKDCPANVSSQEMDDLINKTGYTGFGNNGSVKDYFYDVSGGKMTYVNKVTAYYRAKNPKTYYNDVNVPQPLRAQELITEALDYLVSKGFDFSGITLQGKYAMAVNILYAGSPDVVWAKGLWPHAGSMQAPYNSNVINISKYQMANIGNSPVIGPFCHENGHMLLGYPDLYDSGGDSKGVGMYCLMSAGCYGGALGTNPIPPCPYLRNRVSGWGKITAINTLSPGTMLSLKSNVLDCFQYKGPDSDECFFIESIKKGGRYQSSPSEGLAVWHYDRWGFTNNNQDMTVYGHYLVSLEQADGKFDMEKNVNNGDLKDLFSDVNNSSFTDTTMPNANWWDKKPSGLLISNISSAGDTMSFIYGSFSTPTPIPTPTPDGYSVSGYAGADFSYGESVSAKISEGFNVELSSSQGSFTTKTDKEGYFNINGLKNGTYLYKLYKQNYLERSSNLSIDRDLIIGTPMQPVRLYPGDIAINGVQDKAINMSDIMEIVNHFNSTAGDGKYDETVDFNLDGAVNMADIVIILGNFNKTSSAYPELDILKPTPKPTISVTPTLTPTAIVIPTATPYPSWSGSSYNYKAGDRVTYNGASYQCIQGHTSNGTWDPISALGILWKMIGYR